MSYRILTADDAAPFIKNGDNIGLSGFTASGTPIVVTEDRKSTRLNSIHEIPPRMPSSA